MRRRTVPPAAVPASVVDDRTVPAVRVAGRFGVDAVSLLRLRCWRLLGRPYGWVPGDVPVEVDEGR